MAVDHPQYRASGALLRPDLDLVGRPPMNPARRLTEGGAVKRVALGVVGFAVICRTFSRLGTSARLLEAGVSDLHTFTVVMPGQPGDESLQAREIARRLGTSHHEITLELGDSVDWLAQALDAMDVPSCDGPNTWLVSRAVASEGYKIACSGLGGDELFYGYSSFRFARATGPVLPWLRPGRFVGRWVGHALQQLAAKPRWSRVWGALEEGCDLPALWLMRRGLFSAHEVKELAEFAARSDRLIAHARAGCVRSDSALRQTSALELQLYMHDQLLRDTDAMSMAHALEVRVPLIGKEVVEAVAALSPEWIWQGGAKWFLKRWLADDGLGGLFDGPKQGFALNWPDIWRRYLQAGPRREHVLLDARTAAREHQGFLDGQRHWARSFVVEAAGRTVRGGVARPGRSDALS